MIEIPGYTIEKQLGRGGMARVYLARHTGLDRLVAIKVLSKDLDGDRSFSERFIREARIVANLTHQNIITVHDVGVHNEYHYIAMEYLPGETLDDKIKKKLTAQKALSIIKQIASALDFAHKKGIVHRDVKPDNILFREDGTAVLTDFGIARSAKSETKMTATGAVIGTPHYMSPEQAQGLEIGPWSDIYSLGIVLYEMLSGEVPFDADSTIAVVFKHITEPVPELAEAFSQYQSLVNTMLAKEPAARYQTGREVIADIECLDRGDAPANATLIFNQTAINPAVKLNTTQTTTTTTTTIQPVQPANGKLKIFSAIAAMVILLAGTLLFLNNQAATKTDDTAANQQALNLAYEKQEIKKRQQALDAREAKNALLAQQRLEKEKQDKQLAEQAALQRAQDERIAHEQQARAEAETQKARQELNALKQKQQAARKQAIPATKPVSSEKTVAVKTDIKKPDTKEPAAVKSQNTGLFASWLGNNDNSDEYINDLFKAADNALSNKYYASAEQNYEKILQQEPGNKRAQQGLEKVKQQSSSTQSSDVNYAYIQDLLKAADNALSTDHLSSAGLNYQKILRNSPDNARAINGLNTVFDRHLQLALKAARANDFDEADEHLLAAKKLKPGNEELDDISREIVQLKKAR